MHATSQPQSLSKPITAYFVLGGVFVFLGLLFLNPTSGSKLSTTNAVSLAAPIPVTAMAAPVATPTSAATLLDGISAALSPNKVVPPVSTRYTWSNLDAKQSLEAQELLKGNPLAANVSVTEANTPTEVQVLIPVDAQKRKALADILVVRNVDTSRTIKTQKNENAWSLGVFPSQKEAEAAKTAFSKAGVWNLIAVNKHDPLYEIQFSSSSKPLIERLGAFAESNGLPPINATPTSTSDSKASATLDVTTKK
jgi:hypothetical protein